MIKRSNRRSAASNKVKAELVEEIAALLHQRPGVQVERRVWLPAIGSSSQSREIDVLLTSTVSGHPIRMAIECKNYKERIGVEKIDEFKGKLEDVGIPPQLGIFIAVRGFTRDARRRAERVGIRLMTLSGLTADRLATEVHKAHQSVVFLLAEVSRISILSEASQDHADDLMIFHDSSGNPCGSLPDLIWAEWIRGSIPFELGEYKLPIVLPEGWHWAVEGEAAPNTANVTVRVRGLVISIPGRAENFTLSDAVKGTHDRTHIRVEFDGEKGTYPVTTADTESELREILATSVDIKVVTRVSLPRILLRVFYWPPSDRGFSTLASYVHQRARWGNRGHVDLSDLSVLDVEGSDLSAAWEPVSAGHPAYHDPTWPYSNIILSDPSR